MERGANVNQADTVGITFLHVAIYKGRLEMARCLVKEHGAENGQLTEGGYSPLMLAAQNNNQVLIKHLVHKGARVGTESVGGTALAMLRDSGATAAQIAYPEVRECCANPACVGGGGAKRCAVCKKTRYCGKACQVMHWPVHRVGCRWADDVDEDESLT